MDTISLREAKVDGIPPDIITVVGQPGLDKYVNKKRDKRRIVYDIVFLSQPIKAMYGESLGVTEETVLTDICEVAKSKGRNVI